MKKSIITLAVLSSMTFGALAAGYQAGDIVVRGGATMVDPSSDKATIFAADQTVNLGAGPISASVEDDTQLGLNFVYFLDSNWALELLAATPFKHDITVHTGAGSTNLGETKHLPPTLSALYYFDTNSNFKPYVGVGINYTIFFEEDFNSALQGANSPEIVGLGETLLDAPRPNLDVNDLDLDNSLGLSAQIGVDYLIDEHWSINASARYIDIDTDGSFTAVGGAVPGKVSVDIDPMVYSLMIGYKF
ncbi:outer membrane protein OmpW [Thalassotalea euphylliae]|uniref:Outer membrane protein OmpW n=1 Tax=Thalassotalea euphylliae TaxID=1655234 RepID=A0A3E0TM43_9GAMM|nr:OmpW family outer membrane protein [Thalassotalea euphylliae]REL25115.1 outer membrane protein OmpW [Thalassotalea euphylliae]